MLTDTECEELNLLASEYDVVGVSARQLRELVGFYMKYLRTGGTDLSNTNRPKSKATRMVPVTVNVPQDIYDGLLARDFAVKEAAADLLADAVYELDEEATDD